MSDPMVFATIIKLLSGFLAAVSSLLLWSKTRDSAWLLMVIGVVFLYLDTLLEVLDLFGFVRSHVFYWGDVDLLNFIFSVLPFLFFATGITIFLFRIRRH